MSVFINVTGETDGMFDELKLATDVEFYKEISIVSDGISRNYKGADIEFKDGLMEVRFNGGFRVFRTDSITSYALTDRYDFESDYEMCRMISNQYCNTANLEYSISIIPKDIKLKIIKEFVDDFVYSIGNDGEETIALFMEFETVGELNEAMRERLWETDYCEENVAIDLNCGEIKSMKDLMWVNTVLKKYLPSNDVMETWKIKCDVDCDVDEGCNYCAINGICKYD